MKASITIIGILLFSSTGLFAQVTKPKDSTITFKYLISSDFTFTFGNVNSFINVNQGQLDFEQKIIGTRVLVRYRYGELEKKVNYNEFYSNADLMFFPKHRVYGFLNGGAEFSLLRGVDLRAWGGLGAGFKVLNDVEHNFEPTVGISYEYNRYSIPVVYRGDSTNIINTVVTNIGWTGSDKFFNGKLVLVHNFKWVQDMIFAANYKFSGGFTLGVPVIKNLMFKTSILGSYQNVVPEGKKQGDLIWTIGLSWGNI
jgi:hypothetical protein